MFDLTWIWLLAQLTFKANPIVCCYKLTLTYNSLKFKPILQTFMMDKAHTSSTSTRCNERVVLCVLLLGQTDPTYSSFWLELRLHSLKLFFQLIRNLQVTWCCCILFAYMFKWCNRVKVWLTSAICKFLILISDFLVKLIYI